MEELLAKMSRMEGLGFISIATLLAVKSSFSLTTNKNKYQNLGAVESKSENVK